jgi:hypothetical protein
MEDKGFKPDPSKSFAANAVKLANSRCPHAPRSEDVIPFVQASVFLANELYVHRLTGSEPHQYPSFNGRDMLLSAYIPYFSEKGTPASDPMLALENALNEDVRLYQNLINDYETLRLKPASQPAPIMNVQPAPN